MTINLCFHGIGVQPREREPGESRYWVTESQFLRLLDEIQAEPHVRLSFDDGNRSDFEIALPALTERGLTASFFVIAGRLDDPASLSGADLRQLRAAGMEIGSHSWSHISLRHLSPSDAQHELVDARATLAEASDGAIDDIALPLGQYDRGLLNRLRGLGYRTVFTSDRFPARRTAWLQARYSVTARDDAASIRAILAHRPGLKDARNVLASLVKRTR